MRYNPKDVNTCLPAGEYEATIEKASEGESKAGKEMITIEFKVYTPSGNTFTMKEYIVAESLGKLKALAKAIGSEAAFNSGEFRSEDYVGRSVLLVTKVEEGKGDYGDQARIKHFQPSKARRQPAGAASQKRGYDIGQNDPQDSSEVPF